MYEYLTHETKLSQKPQVKNACIHEYLLPNVCSIRVFKLIITLLLVPQELDITTTCLIMKKNLEILHDHEE